MTTTLIKNFRKYRSEKFGGIGKRLRNIGITANILTACSLVSGLIAVYYLFNNYSLFVLFTLLHLLFDAFDGVVARISKATRFGKYFDLGSDSLITLLALLKTGWFLENYYVFIASGLFLIALVIHFKTALQSPIIYLRTPTLLVLMVVTTKQFVYAQELFIAGYLAVGMVSLYSLAAQARWFVKKQQDSKS